MKTPRWRFQPGLRLRLFYVCYLSDRHVKHMDGAIPLFTDGTGSRWFRMEVMAPRALEARSLVARMTGAVFVRVVQ